MTAPMPREKRISVSIDVMAYNDVVIHFRETPVALKALQDSLSERDWFPGVSAYEWTLLYADYQEAFFKYMHDAEAIGYRDQRKARERAAAARARNTRESKR